MRTPAPQARDAGTVRTMGTAGQTDAGALRARSATGKKGTGVFCSQSPKGATQARLPSPFREPEARRDGASRGSFWSAYLVTMRPYLLPVSALAGLAGLALGGVALSWQWILAVLAFVTSYGFGQALTDCFQQDTDRLSAAYRPLVRGRVSTKQVAAVSLVGLAAGTAALAACNPWNLALCGAAVAGLVAYTPLKRRWWAGPAAPGTSACTCPVPAVRSSDESWRPLSGRNETDLPRSLENTKRARRRQRVKSGTPAPAGRQGLRFRDSPRRFRHLRPSAATIPYLSRLCASAPQREISPSQALAGETPAVALRRRAEKGVSDSSSASIRSFFSPLIL